MIVGATKPINALFSQLIVPLGRGRNSARAGARYRAGSRWGARYRARACRSRAAFAKSPPNEAVGKRVNKKQPMRGAATPREPFPTVRVHALEATPWKRPSGRCTRPSARPNARRSPPEAYHNFLCSRHQPCPVDLFRDESLPATIAGRKFPRKIVDRLVNNGHCGPCHERAVPKNA